MHECRSVHNCPHTKLRGHPIFIVIVIFLLASKSKRCLSLSRFHKGGPPLRVPHRIPGSQQKLHVPVFKRIPIYSPCWGRTVQVILVDGTWTPRNSHTTTLERWVWRDSPPPAARPAAGRVHRSAHGGPRHRRHLAPLRHVRGR